jgi:glycosyltransferase involved in cell wall biosynthesis
MKTKICLISPKVYPIFKPQVQSVFGGAEVQLSILGKELVKNNFEVSFIVADYGQSKSEKIKGIYFFKSFKFSDNFLLKIIKLSLSIINSKSEIIVHRTLTPYSYFLMIFSKILGKKFIYMVAHDFNVELSNSHSLKDKLKKYLFKGSDVVFVQSEYQQKKIKNNWKIESFVFPNSYYIDRPQINKEKKYILWVGRCEDWKRPELFIRLAKEIPSENFLMISPKSHSDSGYFKKIKKQAENLKNLVFIDFVPFDEIEAYFLVAKLFINTSTKEGFPNTFIQALKNEVPIISLSVNPDNFIIKGKVGFVCNNDFKKLIENTNYLLNNKNKLLEFASNGFNYSKEKFDIEKNIKKFIKNIL